MIPHHEEPQHYLLTCFYAWGGENEMQLLLKTNVNLSRLIQTNLPNFIKLFDEQLTDHVDFANHMSDSEIYCIGDIQRKDHESLDDFIKRYCEEVSDDALATHHANSIQIGVNKNHNSSFDGFTLLSNEDALVLEKHMPSARIVEIIL